MSLLWRILECSPGLGWMELGRFGGGGGGCPGVFAEIKELVAL